MSSPVSSKIIVTKNEKYGLLEKIEFPKEMFECLRHKWPFTVGDFQVDMSSTFSSSGFSGSRLRLASNVVDFENFKMDVPISREKILELVQGAYEFYIVKTCSNDRVTVEFKDGKLGMIGFPKETFDWCRGTIGGFVSKLFKDVEIKCSNAFVPYLDDGVFWLDRNEFDISTFQIKSNVFNLHKVDLFFLIKELDDAYLEAHPTEGKKNDDKSKKDSDESDDDESENDDESDDDKSDDESDDDESDSDDDIECTPYLAKNNTTVKFPQSILEQLQENGNNFPSCYKYTAIYYNFTKKYVKIGNGEDEMWKKHKIRNGTIEIDWDVLSHKTIIRDMKMFKKLAEGETEYI